MLRCRRAQLLLIVVLMLFFSGWGQSLAAQTKRLEGKRINLREAKISMDKVIRAVQKQSGISIFYSNQLLDGKEKINVSFNKTPLKDVLNELFSNRHLEWKFFPDKNTILISPRPVKEEPKDTVPPAHIQPSDQMSVSGHVVSDQGEPLPGISVFVKGSKLGTATDANGIFSISGVEKSGTLVLKGLNLDDRIVHIDGRNKLGTITMITRIDTLQDQVVVTGYQELQKRTLTGSISTLNMNDLQTVYQPNVDKLLQGQVPGLTVMSTSGAPGAIPQIRIRGTSTLSGNVQPLWVVDGVILDDAINVSVDDILTNRNLIASGIGGVNVDDIESINVLKDAAATAIYGTKAANGVIVITSKKGRSGKTRINFSSNLTLQQRPRIEDAYMMNSKERIDVNREMIARGVFNANSPAAGEYNTVSDFERYFIDVMDRKISWDDFNKKVGELETVNTDWFKYLFRNSIVNRQNISFSGGNEKTTFYASGSYMDDQATAKGVGQKTYTGALKVYTKLYKDLRIGFMMDVSARENRSFFGVDSKENPYEYAIYTTRAQPAFDENGDYSYFYLNGMEYNFLENRGKGWRSSKNFGMRGTVDLEWKFMKDVTFTSLFSYGKQQTTDNDIAVDDSYFVRIRKRDNRDIINGEYVSVWKDGGYRKDRNSYNGNITFRNQLVYNPLFNNKHYLNVMVGQEVRKSRFSDETTEIYGYSHDRGHQQIPQFDYMERLGIPYWSESLNESAALSYFGAANYTYDNRYTVSFSARTDGSNRFGLKTNQLFQPLWAVGANYQIKEENFLKDVDWISYLTLRGSYGSQGNVAAQAYSDIVARIGQADPINPSNYLVIAAPKNPNLKWEQTFSSDVALEFGLFKRHIMASVEWYNKKATDLLGNRQVSQVTGFDVIQVNWAKMRNRGWEFSLSSINIDSKDFRWSTTLNYGINSNTVQEVYTIPTVQSLTNQRRSEYAAAALVGFPIDGLWSYRFAGLNEDGRATFYTAKDGEKVLNGMTNIDGLKYSGVINPRAQLGFTNTFSYKKFTLSALFVGSFGNVIRLRNMSNGSYLGFPDPTQNMSKEWVGRWRQPGDEAHTTIPVLETGNDYALTGSNPTNGAMFDNSDLRTVKGDFLRFQNLSIAYNYFTPGLRKLGIQNIRLALQGSNLYVWKAKELTGQDPEAQGSSVLAYSSSTSKVINFGNTFLPISRSYSLSLNIQF